jgi:transcriptional regulator with XRE-family HTH domain
MARLKKLREQGGLSAEQVEERLILGPGWVSCFESGETMPSISMVLAILNLLGRSVQDLVRGLPKQAFQQVERQVYAEASGADLLIRFVYAKYNAVYELPSASTEEFDEVLKTLRDGLSRLTNPADVIGEAAKADAVARAFLKAVQLWPHANPSDLWWFLISRAYCDPYNHPARVASMDFAQSWKRTGGWALEEVMVRHYGPFLSTKGLNIFIAPSDTKQRLLGTVLAGERLEADKADVLLTGRSAAGEHFFGVVHVKASLAERRTDDVPMSKALIAAGYASPLWTMDCKSMPGLRPVNKGELGLARSGSTDNRSAKRKDIEDDGYFSACFSYNRRTVPTPPDQKAKARVLVCDFRNPDDPFSAFLIAKWQGFLKKARKG